MRFLLVRPHVSLDVAKSFLAFLHLEPLALEIVAGGIEAPHEVQILDLTLSRKPSRDFDRKLERFKPDVMGFGGYSNQASNVKALAARAKALCPSVFITVGGVHATIAPTDYHLPGLIDVVIRGEGATAVRKLVHMLESGSGLVEDEHGAIIPVSSPQFNRLAGLPPPELPDYDQVPSPRRDLVDRSRYFCVQSGEYGERLKTLFPRVATMRTSTGCPHRCNFCVVHFLARGKYLQRTPQAVVDEIASIPEDVIYFVDDEMFINAKRTQEIAELLIERGIKKSYISWARSDTICKHEELFRLWKQAGLHVLYVGLESMEEENLEDYNKGFDPVVNRQAVDILRRLDIQLHAALMVNPDFRQEDFIKVRKTVDSLVPAEVTFTVFSPPPGTPLWNEHKDQFICEDPHLFYDCMHSILPTALPMNQFYRYFSLLYLFAFRNNPWRIKRNKAPCLEVCRLLLSGVRCGWRLRRIYRDYDPALW